MRKLLFTALNTVVLMGLASVAFAAAVTPETISMIAIATAIGMGIAAFGCGVGQGLGLKGACEGTARNPEASGKITVILLLGMAFIESLAIYTLVIALILLFANPLIG